MRLVDLLEKIDDFDFWNGVVIESSRFYSFSFDHKEIAILTCGRDQVNIIHRKPHLLRNPEVSYPFFFFFIQDQPLAIVLHLNKDSFFVDHLPEDELDLFGQTVFELFQFEGRLDW